MRPVCGRTLDHLTGGRAAWNVVTSINHNQQANYGTERADADTRYDQAHEYMEVLPQTLGQLGKKARVVMDKEGAIFADASKVHRIEHEGQFFKSRGPLNVVRSPQNGPLHPAGGHVAKGVWISRPNTPTEFLRSNRARRMPLNIFRM